MADTQLSKIIEELRDEQHISPMEDDIVIEGYLKEGQYDINDLCGNQIDYESDLKARSLLKNYVFYARYGKLAEFKQMYAGEYAYLQAKYYKPSDI